MTFSKIWIPKSTSVMAYLKSIHHLSAFYHKINSLETYVYSDAFDIIYLKNKANIYYLIIFRINFYYIYFYLKSLKK